MLNIKHIALIIDNKLENTHSLTRGLKVAEAFDAKITILTCVYQNSIEHLHHFKTIDKSTLQREIIEYHQKAISKLANEIQFDRAFEIKVLWHKRFHRGVLDFINQSDIGLVVKCAGEHSALKNVFLPTDWHLLRETKVPVLLVKNGSWPKANNVLAAVNIDSDSAHQALNHDIIDATLQVAKLSGGEPHVLNVFPWPLVDLAQLQHIIMGEDHFKIIKNAHQKALTQYVDGKPIKVDNIHVAEGVSPEETIPEIIRSTGAGLIVIGTVGRHGLKGMTIGNTAEKILDQVNCEVLAIK